MSGFFVEVINTNVFTELGKVAVGIDFDGNIYELSSNDVTLSSRIFIIDENKRNLLNNPELDGFELFEQLMQSGQPLDQLIWLLTMNVTGDSTPSVEGYKSNTFDVQAKIGFYTPPHLATMVADFVDDADKYVLTDNTPKEVRDVCVSLGWSVVAYYWLVSVLLELNKKGKINRDQLSKIYPQEEHLTGNEFVKSSKKFIQNVRFAPVPQISVTKYAQDVMVTALHIYINDEHVFNFVSSKSLLTTVYQESQSAEEPLIVFGILLEEAYDN